MLRAEDTVRLPGDRIAPMARSWALRQAGVKQVLKGQQQGYYACGQGRHTRPLVVIWSSLPCSYNLSSFCTKSSQECDPRNLPDRQEVYDEIGE